VRSPHIGAHIGAIARNPQWKFRYEVFYTAGSELQEKPMTQGTVQIVAGVLAVVLVVIAVMRHKKNKKKDEDDF
jgi:hypothetical protein